MLVAIGLWWIYFDLISHHLPLPGNLTVPGWMYLHLPMTMGIAAVGAAILNVVEGAGETLPAEVRWLLVGATAVVLVSIAALTRTIQVSEDYRPIYRTGGRALLLSVALIMLLGFTNLTAIPLLLALNLLLLAPLFYGLKTWLGIAAAGASSPT
jgi:low temperature requirement protein LtrA